MSESKIMENEKFKLIGKSNKLTGNMNLGTEAVPINISADFTFGG